MTSEASTTSTGISRFSAKSPKLPEPCPRQDIISPANDRVLLRGTMFRPKENPENIPNGIITVHSGTGVPQGFYHRFAETVAEKGYGVITYDYRGIGQSALKTDQNNEDIRMSDWITKDIPGVIEWAKETYPDVPHFAVGHAVGGHGIAYAGSEGTYDAAALVNCRGMRISKVPSVAGKVRAFFIFNILGPISGFITGHIPASAWRLAVEPPNGVMRQWARWARKEGYFFDDSEFDFANRFSKAPQPFLSIRVPDDYWTEESSADLITNVMSSAEKIEKRQAQPAGGKGVGYGGYFRSGHEKEWDELLDWFQTNKD